MVELDHNVRLARDRKLEEAHHQAEADRIWSLPKPQWLLPDPAESALPDDHQVLIDRVIELLMPFASVGVDGLPPGLSVEQDFYNQNKYRFIGIALHRTAKVYWDLTVDFRGIAIEQIESLPAKVREQIIEQAAAGDWIRSGELYGDGKFS